MMPRPSGGGKGPVFSLTPWMIDMTRSPVFTTGTQQNKGPRGASDAMETGAVCK